MKVDKPLTFGGGEDLFGPQNNSCLMKQTVPITLLTSRLRYHFLFSILGERLKGAVCEDMVKMISSTEFLI